MAQGLGSLKRDIPCNSQIEWIRCSPDPDGYTAKRIGASGGIDIHLDLNIALALPIGGESGNFIENICALVFIPNSNAYSVLLVR